MKRLLLFALWITILRSHSFAQVSRMEYKTILRLDNGDQVKEYLSCWWLNERNEPRQVVIQHPDGSLSTITNGIRKDGLTQDQIMPIAACKKCDPSRAPGESHHQFGKLLSNDQWHIQSPKKDYGVYDKIIFMRELDNRFVAVVASGKKDAEQVFFIDSDGQKTLLVGRPVQLITNQDLTRSAVVLSERLDVNDMTPELTRRVWFNDNKTITVQKKSRLGFDASGRHFIQADPKVFYIDGVTNQRDVSGAGTQLFVNQNGSNWAYFYMIYLTFKDNYTIQSAITPFITTEDGKDYLNWFKVEREGGNTVLKQDKRQL